MCIRDSAYAAVALEGAFAYLEQHAQILIVEKTDAFRDSGLFLLSLHRQQQFVPGKRVFENVKPVNVIQYFINMAAKDGDIVMDFFSGAATTAHAVMQTEADKNRDLHYKMCIRDR